MGNSQEESVREINATTSNDENDTNMVVISQEYSLSEANIAVNTDENVIIANTQECSLRASDISVNIDENVVIENPQECPLNEINIAVNTDENIIIEINQEYSLREVNISVNTDENVITANDQDDSLSEVNIAVNTDENVILANTQECLVIEMNTPIIANQNNQTITNNREGTRTTQDNDALSAISKEIAIQSLDLNIGATCSFQPPRLDFTSVSFVNDAQATAVSTSFMPLVFSSRPSSFSQSPVTSQPLPTFSNLPSPMSFSLTHSNQPPSLFLQALSKLSESSLNVTVLNRMKDNLSKLDPKFLTNIVDIENTGLHTPDSLTSAPPSYSFVLRQMQARRRPRLMGTFIPSPSFVQHTPPPNYATAFDLYVENPMPPQPTRVFDFGFAPMPAICPECGYSGMTVVTSKITLCTHLCAFLLFIFCCWLCSPLPYILRSCKDVHHYCRNCRIFLGMYSPTSPDSNFTQ